MTIIDHPDAIREQCRAWRRDGLSLGFVPTMGNLHEGHLSLIRRAAADGFCLASIFVNPLQFGAGEDFANYPRTFADDCAAAEAAGAGAIFAPAEPLIYPPGFATSVEVAGLTDVLCGRSRPGHFRGVTTVVMKLFCLTLPDRAYFGEKDYQQMVVIRRMTEDLGLGTEIVPMPIVREPDGLAMSSRNRYLGASERAAATCLYRGLRAAERAVGEGATASETITAAARIVIAREPAADIDYVELVEPETLQSLPVLDRPGRLCLAVRIGPARLIDNLALTPPGAAS